MVGVRRGVGVVATAAVLGSVLGFTGAVVEGVAPDDSPIVAPAASAAPVPGGLGYTALVSPCRAVDTRKPGVPGGDLANGDLRSFQMRGSSSMVGQGGSASGCGVPSSATAVEVSVTVPGTPVGTGFLRAAPTGTSVNAVFLNYTNGRGITNTGTVPLNTVFVQDLSVSNLGGSAHVVIDIQGYFSPSGGASYVPLSSPCRVVDTRGGAGVVGNGAVRAFQVAGTGANFASQGGVAGGCGVPDEVPGVELSLTVITPSGANGFVQVSPSDTSTSAAFINYTVGVGITNTGSVSLSAGGPIDLQIRNQGGSIQVAVDVQGYYTTAPGQGTRYQTVTPCRTVDTRNAGGPLAPGQTRTFRTAGDRVGFVSQGTANVTGCEVPHRAAAVEASLTAVNPSGVGFTRPGPAGAVAAATFLNYTPVGGITNTGTLPLALGGLADLGITNAGGTTSYLVDVLGYYEPAPELPRSVETVSASQASACHVVAGGEVECWGENFFGNAGIGTRASPTTPARVPGITAAVQVEGPGDHTCALIGDGTVECWGSNDSGELGDGTTGDRLVPGPVPGLSGVVQIAVGPAFSCALLADRTVRCWGLNEFGQIGDGTFDDRGLPTVVQGLSGVAQIDAGGSHACALLVGGSVRCWGANFSGQLGDGGVVESSTPVAVSGLVGVVQVGAGISHSCAVLAGGTARCWGQNTSGQLGDGTTIGRLTPVPVTGLGEVAAIALSRGHTCAVRIDGSIRCWGENSDFRLGDGTNDDRTTPVAVTGVSRAVDVTAGETSTCAVLAAGTARCWGDNAGGQLGTGDRVARVSPTTPVGQVGVVQVATGGGHSCALLAVGTVRCWGDNQSGQLGDGTSGTDRSTPVTVTGLSGVIALDAGEAHTCAVLFDRTVRCWGFNGSGQLGDGTSGNNRLTPVAPGVAGVASVSAGLAHTCAVRVNGLVFCWGFNSFGQVGNGFSGSNSPTPQLVASGAVDVAAGDGHTCAARRGAVAACWGLNTLGQVGDGTTGTNRVTPVSVATASTPVDTAAVSVGAGASHSCAVTPVKNSAAGFVVRSGVRCWGRNTSGQLGDGTVVQRAAPTPDSVGGLLETEDALHVAVGGNHSCAVVVSQPLDSQEIRCWGENADGQVGDGTSGIDRLEPVVALQSLASPPFTSVVLAEVAQVDAGGSHTCAALADGTARCWGSNSDGQLGTGTVGGIRITASATVRGLVDP